MRFLIVILSAAACVFGQQAQPQAQAAEQVYSVGNGVSAPRVVKQVAPEHPSRGFKITGTVSIGLVVTSSGEPNDVHVVRSLEKDVDQAAVEAVQKWRFEPAKKDGTPVAARVTVEIRFHDM